MVQSPKDFDDQEYNIAVTGKNIEITKPIRDYIDEKIAKIEMITNHIIDIHVRLDNPFNNSSPFENISTDKNYCSSWLYNLRTGHVHHRTYHRRSRSPCYFKTQKIQLAIRTL